MMNDTGGERQAGGDEPAGLCATCAHMQIVTSGRGSRFYMCRLSFTDPRFARYPPIPVIACAGHEPRGPHSAP